MTPKDIHPEGARTSRSEDAAGVSYGLRLTQLAAERPDEVDLIFVDHDGSEHGTSFRELEVRANQVARQLQQHGVVQDDIVALALPTCLEHVVVTLAIWKLGATLLPLRHDLPQWERERLLDLARPKVVVADTDRCAAYLHLSRDDLASSTSNADGPLEDRTSECVNLIASSGSTGHPKLIVVPARGVVGDDAQMALMRGGTRPTALVCSPLYHVNGFSYVAPLLLEGGRIVVMKKFDAALAVELIERHRVTMTILVPTMLQRIARLGDVTPERLESLTRVLCGGGKIPEWVIDRWLELVDPSAFMIVYGQSERIGVATMTGDEWPSHRGAAGRPADVELSIRDPDDGRVLPHAEVGEIFMRPRQPRTMFRYVGIPTPPPTEDRFYSVGDLGWLDDEGYLFIADRRNDLIISGGANVYPAEVEAALSEHPQVVDQVVVGVPDDEWGHRVHAIVQPADPEAPPAESELRSFCRDRLAPFKVPKTFEYVEQVPRSEAGKLNRTALGARRR